MTFDDWCLHVRDRFQQRFGYAPPKAPSMVELDSRIQERIMRCGVEARRFDLEHHDDLAILAHHTLIMDDVREGFSNSHARYVSSI
ncbi:hypothetical protein HOU00_gp158 [Caulobacter phage CcrPW]|uniref:Uncharacterized protein n=1 Tax=Caulobacter phage CcrPW TaxID=2283271 RepID=A0A385EDS0_9CAUD|nr:hypothetical protein HOU00_gp158 [Caulobacter phage CcrPW]AXQ68967.1 hypothetical protein CcrPW_gp428c [Caulobacter phage CcrPW]